MLGSELLDDELWGKCWDLESSDTVTILNLLMDSQHSGVIEGGGREEARLADTGHWSTLL